MEDSDHEQFLEKEKPDSRLVKIFCDIRVQVTVMAVVIVLLTVGGQYIFTYKLPSEPEQCQLAYQMRLSCFPTTPNTPLNSKSCEELGCCWDNLTSVAPWCFHSYTSKIHRIERITNTCADKKLTGKIIKLTDNKSESIIVDFSYVNSHVLQMRITPIGKYFQLENFLNRDRSSYNSSHCENGEGEDRFDYDIRVPEEEKFFKLEILRRNTDTAVFSTGWLPLIFNKQFLEVTTLLPSWDVFGLGERPHSTLKHNTTFNRTWPLFARDDGAYGAHPFYLCLEGIDGRAHGVLVSTANAMDVTVTAAPSVTFRSTGNSLLLHLLMGPSPDDVVRQLMDIVGKPSFPPYWALGRHDCRPANDKAGSVTGPVESICVLDNRRDSLYTAVENAKASGQRVILVDSPQIRDEEVTSDGPFVLNGTNGHFLEVFSDDATEWLRIRYSNISDSFDGLMLTRNAPTTTITKDGCNLKSSMNRPPYNPLGKEPLSNRTICMDACHDKADNCRNGLSSPVHYNLHNLYGMKYSSAVYAALTKTHPKTRPFLTSLSTFPGSGQFGGHWGGRPTSNWTDIKIALVQALEFNLYGIPMTGAPACGFVGKPETLDVCTRWWQMAAFQPLLLSHRMEANPNENDNTVKTGIENAVLLRYSLLPYLYTLLYKASVNGTAVMRPLFMEFPKDRQTYNIDQQFFWGPALLISPVLTQANKDMIGYVPCGCWYDYYSGRLIFTETHGSFRNFSAVEYNINLHLRGGHIIPGQKAETNGTAASRLNPLKAYVALDCLNVRWPPGESLLASGDFFLDDGESTLEQKQHFLVRMRVTRIVFGSNRRVYDMQLMTEPEPGHLEAAQKFKDTQTNVVLDTIVLLGQPEAPRSCHYWTNGTQDETRRVDYIVQELPKFVTFRNVSWDLRMTNKIICKYH